MSQNETRPDAGLIAFSPEGIIIASNRQTRFSLQDLPVTPGQSFDTVFRTSYQRFLAQARIHDSGQITDRRGEYLLLPDFELGASGQRVGGSRIGEQDQQQ
jgi:hypothetical protein